ncbi:MAG: alpha/beta hydrolase [Bacteroidales bacterium]
MSKTQIFYIHGGTTFRTKRDYLHFLKTRNISIEKWIRWSDSYLDQKLGKNFQIIRPRMPRQDGATYSEWAIHFERFFPKLKNNVILVGQSLGGIFLAKYLSENKFPKKILSTYLICPPFDGKDTLSSEVLAGGFKLKSNLSLLEKNCKKLTLMFSANDPVVRPSQAKMYAAKLKNANILVYKHIAGHFQISEFPEFVAMIKKDVKKR